MIDENIRKFSYLAEVGKVIKSKNIISYTSCKKQENANSQHEYNSSK